MGGFDIGAFELCLEGVGAFQQPCPVIVGVERPDQLPVQLTVQVQPGGGGTTTPPPGTTEVLEDTVIALAATPNPGYRFLEWSNNVANAGDPATTVFMDGSQTVTASFFACACATDVTATMGVASGAVARAKKRQLQTVIVTNNSSNTVNGPISLVLDRLTENVTLSNANGETVLMVPAGSPYVNTRATLAPGQSVAFQLQFDHPGSVDISFTARVLAGAGSR